MRIPRRPPPPVRTPRGPAHDGPAAARVHYHAKDTGTRRTALHRAIHQMRRMTRRIPRPSRDTAVRLALAALLLTCLALLALTGNLAPPGPDQALALRDRLLDLHARHPVASVAAYVAGYVAMTACSIPGAVFLTLTGGAVFGFGTALAAVSAASTIGACLAFLSARHLLRTTVRRLWPRQLARIDAAMAEGGDNGGTATNAAGATDEQSPGSRLFSPGALCLLGLRCVAVMPYWLVNLLFGVTAMRLYTFATVSLLGMLPLNAIYVHAGAELGRIRHLGDIISLRTGLALCLLAVAPVLLRRVAGAMAGRRQAGNRCTSAPGQTR